MRFGRAENDAEPSDKNALVSSDILFQVQIVTKIFTITTGATFDAIFLDLHHLLG
jgi:hypothetical protein